MLDHQTVLEQTFLEMRQRCLSLAADLDRLDRAERAAAGEDERLAKLRRAIGVLHEDRGDRAQRVQMIFSDITPPPVLPTRDGVNQ